MARRKTSRGIRTTWPPGTVFELCVGQDFFGDGLNGDRDELRRAWRDEAVRAAVYERQAERGVSDAPWAEREFGLRG